MHTDWLPHLGKVWDMGIGKVILVFLGVVTVILLVGLSAAYLDTPAAAVWSQFEGWPGSGILSLIVMGAWGILLVTAVLMGIAANAPSRRPIEHPSDDKQGSLVPSAPTLALPQFDLQGVLKAPGFEFRFKRVEGIDWLRGQVLSTRRVWACWLIGFAANAGNLLGTGRVERLVLLHPDSPVVDALPHIGKDIALPAKVLRQAIMQLTERAKGRTEVRWCDNMVYSLLMIGNPPDDFALPPKDMWVLVEAFVPGIHAEQRPQFQVWQSNHPEPCSQMLQAFRNIWDYSTPPENQIELLKKRVDRAKEALVGVLYVPYPQVFDPTPKNLERLSQLVEQARVMLEESGHASSLGIFDDRLTSSSLTETDQWPNKPDPERTAMIHAFRAIEALIGIRKNLGS